jgi:predicted RecB family nuclease
MQYVDGQLVFSATDLNNFLECRRLTELENEVARGLATPPDDEDEQTKLVRRKGEEHEAAYLARLERELPGVVRIERSGRSLDAYHAAEAQTLDAMRAGAPVIYQATLFDGRFVGHADFLRRVERPSTLGAWSYEVADTKLALSSKPYFLIQLCNYSEHLQRLQGVTPRHGYIILGNNQEQAFLIHDYEAYYRHLKNEFLTFVERASLQDEPREYPVPRKHCSYCPWDGACEAQRVADDHLSIVAWMRRDQILKFEDAGIKTVTQLAGANDGQRPAGMNPETFVKLRRQAALQVRGADGTLHYELLRHNPKTGFGILPAPSNGDVFFDMEGDPLYEPGRSLEYLFGAWTYDEPHYHAFWGLKREEEKSAFEAFVDFIMERRRRFPDLHVYHYANYEKAALRRLAQQHATREAEVDELLRNEVLVDLYAVVRQAIAISQNSYSIKRLEKYYDLKRSTSVKKGDDSIVMFERWLTDGDEAILRDIEAYNRDDCYSTYLLLDWLLKRREEAQREHGTEYPFREKEATEAPKRDEALERQASELERALLAEVPLIEERLFDALPDEVRQRYLVGHALSYHRREDKPVWWAFFDRCDNVDDLLEFDREAIAGLAFDENVAARAEARSKIFTYRMPEQRYKLGSGDDVYDPYIGKRIGSIVSIDEDRGLLELKTTRGEEYARSITALIPGGPLNTNEQRRAIARVAQSLADGRLRAAFPAVADLLSRATPRVRGVTSGDALQPETVTAATVSHVVQNLDCSVLFIQGPPGSGKTTTCSSVIADLLQRGARVGVVSTGHKAIHHLLHKVEAEMWKRGAIFRGLYKHSSTSAHSEYRSQLPRAMILSMGDNSAFEGLDFNLAGGTSWLFSRPELSGAFDYLFIDEAGQVSLADAIAVAGCAKNLVLLGDPAQLAQVSQGSHPYRAGWSVLEHVLGEESTVPPDRGIFLDVSYRMQPDICDFISLAMYDGRLAPGAKTQLHSVRSAGLTGGGLGYIPIAHAANTASSVEEAERIVREIALLREGFVTDDDGIERPMRDSDIIVVTPYNAQRRLIERRLRDAGLNVAVGTVDKFQGQEAAVVFYSMATSSGEDVPRDLQFLFEQNRFNVAVSRARALSVLVCSPRLLDVSCNSPEQMAMINFVCAYVEKSTLPLRPGVSAAASADLESRNG